MGEWWERCKGAQHLELASRKRDESHWRVHVEPRWGTVQLGSILKPDVTRWVVDMQKAGVGAPTIEGAVKVLRSLLEQAVDARKIRLNPATKVSKPKPNASVHRVLYPDEESQLLARLTELFGDRVDGRLFVEMLFDTGLRWEEAAALRRESVDMRRRLVNVTRLMERDGTIREYAKSEAGRRPVPVSDELWPRLRAVVLATPPGGLVFRSPAGDKLHYSNWLGRVWKPALLGEPTGAAVKRPGRRGPAPKPKGEPYLDGEQPTPHDARHTYGTRLADQGVPQHKIMKLMGHKDRRASDVYIDAGEERFDEAREAMDRARGRTSKPGESGPESAGFTG